MIKGPASFASFCLVLGLTACNLPGENNNLSFTASTGATTNPPLSGTGGSGSRPMPIPAPPVNQLPPASSGNTLSVQVGGTGVCGVSNVNQPCASVTICTPGTNNCQTVTDLLVDTGSYGLRIFSSALTVALQQLQDSRGRSLAECAQFGTGADWGPVMQASVGLAGENRSLMPIEVIDSGYAGGPPSVAQNSGCTGVDTSPQQAGYNGILGIGLFTQDCGSTCESNSANGIYYGCTGTTCSGASVSLANQVVNPVSMLLSDNNGVAFTLPAVGANGATVADGSVAFGVGTQADNTPGGVKTYFADNVGNLTTVFNGSSYPESFIDSGSNGLFFPGPASLPECTSNGQPNGWFCPASTTAFSATNLSAIGGASGVVAFSVASMTTLTSSGDVAFDDLGGNSSSSGFSNSFDWGLPFFFGKTVYIGVSGAKSSLGTGPYWAY